MLILYFAFPHRYSYHEQLGSCYHMLPCSSSPCLLHRTRTPSGGGESGDEASAEEDDLDDRFSGPSLPSYKPCASSSSPSSSPHMLPVEGLLVRSSLPQQRGLYDVHGSHRPLDRRCRPTDLSRRHYGHHRSPSARSKVRAQASVRCKYKRKQFATNTSASMDNFSHLLMDSNKEGYESPATRIPMSISSDRLSIRDNSRDHRLAYSNEHLLDDLHQFPKTRHSKYASYYGVASKFDSLPRTKSMLNVRQALVESSSNGSSAATIKADPPTPPPRRKNRQARSGSIVGSATDIPSKVEQQQSPSCIKKSPALRRLAPEDDHYHNVHGAGQHHYHTVHGGQHHYPTTRTAPPRPPPPCQEDMYLTVHNDGGGFIKHQRLKEPHFTDSVMFHHELSAWSRDSNLNKSLSLSSISDSEPNTIDCASHYSSGRGTGFDIFSSPIPCTTPVVHQGKCVDQQHYLPGHRLQTSPYNSRPQSPMRTNVSSKTGYSFSPLGHQRSSPINVSFSPSKSSHNMFHQREDSYSHLHQFNNNSRVSPHELSSSFVTHGVSASSPWRPASVAPPSLLHRGVSLQLWATHAPSSPA